MGFEIQRGFWRNLNVYTALALVFVFLHYSGLLPNIESPVFSTNPILKVIITILFLIGAGASLLFIITKMLKQ